MVESGLFTRFTSSEEVFARVRVIRLADNGCRGALEEKKGEIVATKYNRDACCYSFYGYASMSYTKKFKIDVENIKKYNDEEYEVRLLMSDFGNADVEKLYGEKAYCNARVKLHKNIPVFSKFIMESNEA